MDGSVQIETGSPTPPAAAESVIKRPKVKVKPNPLPNPKKNDKSEIAFPYMDLDAGITVARAMIGAGGVALSREQLAGVMNLAAGSGNFVAKIATARTFNLVKSVQGKYELTDLGFQIVDSNETRQRVARAESFLSVALYRRVYDEFKGKQLPPRPQGLEQAFIRFGVAPKQAANARIVFDRSAKQAGFFASGPERLIEPIIGSAPQSERSRGAFADDDGGGDDEPPQIVTGGRAAALRGLHPFVLGLLQSLPEPHTVWSIEGRAAWLKAAAQNFTLMYQGEGAIEVTVATASVPAKAGQ